MSYQFKLPDIGEGVHEGEIVQWLVKVGDMVAEDQVIVEIMTDKVTAEIPSPVAGVIQELRGKAGDVIPVGTVLAVFDKEGSKPQTANTVSENGHQSVTAVNATLSADKAIAANIDAKSASDRSNPFNQGQSIPLPLAENPLAAPATRKLARELGLSLQNIPGTGPNGRITPMDVRTFHERAGTSANLTTPEQKEGVPPTLPLPRKGGGDISSLQSHGERRVPFGGLRRKIAERLVRSKQHAPHFGYVEEVEMTRLVALRNDLSPLAEAQGVKLTYLPLIIKAVIAGLRQYPSLNAKLDEDKQELVYHHDYHVGIAVATDQGLVVPVVPFADQKSPLTLAKEIKSLSEKARAGRLALEELRGGTITLTSIGSIGGIFSMPILNHPEAAILGINRIEKRPVVRCIDGEDQIVIREMMYLSLSCDHRVVDGAEAALFVKEVIRYLENPGLLLLSEGL